MKTQPNKGICCYQTEREHTGRKRRDAIHHLNQNGNKSYLSAFYCQVRKQDTEMVLKT